MITVVMLKRKREREQEANTLAEELREELGEGMGELCRTVVGVEVSANTSIFRSSMFVPKSSVFLVELSFF